MQEPSNDTPASTASSEPAPSDIASACDALQRELDALLAGAEAGKAASSLDNAIASLKEVEQRNVSTVQLVALA